MFVCVRHYGGMCLVFDAMCRTVCVAMPRQEVPYRMGVTVPQGVPGSSNRSGSSSRGVSNTCGAGNRLVNQLPGVVSPGPLSMCVLLHSFWLHLSHVSQWFGWAKIPPAGLLCAVVMFRPPSCQALCLIEDTANNASCIRCKES